MTMRYTHIGIDDQAKAVGNLPIPKTSPKPHEAAKPGEDAALQMRCISGGAALQSVSSRGTNESADSRHNPKQDRGFGTNCHRLSLAVKTNSAGGTPAPRGTSYLGNQEPMLCGCVSRKSRGPRIV